MKKIYLTEVVLLTKSYNLQDFKDWLHWHLDIIGFDHCHIFDNESTVDIETVCKSYGSKVSYEKVIGWPDQYNLYNRYINNESKAWWVLPIDDDEFLYISDKYNNNVKNMILSMQKQYPAMQKLSIGWRNMFPLEFTEIRTKSLIENAVGWSDYVCTQIYPLWRQDNRYVKTFTCMINLYYWGKSENKLLDNSGHNPVCFRNRKLPAYLPNGKLLLNKDCQDLEYDKRIDDILILHYQYKSNKEWIEKCTKRISAASKSFDKNKPFVYKKLYEYQKYFKLFDDALKVWKNG